MNEILRSAPSVPHGVPEQDEALVLTIAQQLIREVGADAYEEMVLRICLPIEAQIRQDFPDGCAATRLLDRYHARARNFE